ncbi:MAG: hypothetical protein AVDCRST_MAG13-1405, partial [uncultured Solirubrobacteraceae bacterium]
GPAHLHRLPGLPAPRPPRLRGGARQAPRRPRRRRLARGGRRGRHRQALSGARPVAARRQGRAAGGLRPRRLL